LFYQLLYELSQIIPEVQHQRGRKPIQIKDLFFSACLKLYNGHSGRKISYDLEQAEGAKFIFKKPHYNTLSDFLNNPATYNLLSKILTISAMPLKELETSFAMDSSGFGSYQYQRWMRTRFYSPKTEWRNYIKAHVVIGVKTNVICSAEITPGNFSDVKQAPLILEKARGNFNIKEVSGDKAYSAYRILQIVDSMGAMPFIVFQDRVVKENKNAPPIWNRTFNYFKNHKEDFMKRYHKRSNVETVFAMVKTRLGEFLKYKTFESQKNELLVKLICHNICCVVQEIFENGVNVDFNGCEKRYVQPDPKRIDKLYVLPEGRLKNPLE
jgi:transposase